MKLASRFKAALWKRNRQGRGYDAGGGRSVRETVTADSQNQLLFALRKVRGDLDSRCDAIEALQTEQVQKMKEGAS